MSNDELVGEFIDDFLAHRRFYDPRKAHEYYMRTRKLVGKGPKGIQRIDLNPFDNDKKKTAPSAPRGLDPKVWSKLPKHGSMEFNPDAKLDTSQIQDKRSKDDPSRGHKSDAEKKKWREKKYAVAQAKVDRIGEMLDRVMAQQKKTPMYDVRKQYKLTRLRSKLIQEYKKAIAEAEAYDDL